MDIKILFRKYPKIIVSTTDTLIKTAQHLHVSLLWMDQNCLSDWNYKKESRSGNYFQLCHMSWESWWTELTLTISRYCEGGCSTMHSGRYWLMFQRSLLPPWLGWWMTHMWNVCGRRVGWTRQKPDTCSRKLGIKHTGIKILKCLSCTFTRTSVSQMQQYRNIQSCLLWAVIPCSSGWQPCILYQNSLV
jgi:hypothetical protein